MKKNVESVLSVFTVAKFLFKMFSIVREGKYRDRGPANQIKILMGLFIFLNYLDPQVKRPVTEAVFDLHLCHEPTT